MNRINSRRYVCYYVIDKNIIIQQLASDQARIAEIMETVQAEVDRHDQMILQLEKQLHDAHHTLVREACLFNC